MSTAVIVLLLLLGIVLIVKGGDAFVDAASWIAEAFHIPKFIIGATIVSLATTLPELLVSTFAAFQGKTDMAIGNAVGSVTANLGLIMGISVFCMPGAMKRSQFALKGVLMIAAAALIYFFSGGGALSSKNGLLLLAIFAVFIVENVRDAKCAMGGPGGGKPEGGLALNMVKFVLGTVGIVLGAQLLVDNGSELARRLGIPEGIIGVTIIAIGTSLPELVTTLTAIAKKQSSLSIGNIIGANVIDLTLILPISSVITQGSLPVAEQSIRLDFPVCILVSLIAILPPLISGRFRRWQGVALLATYGAYLFALCTMFL